jgi:hypothetical protein
VIKVQAVVRLSRQLELGTVGEASRVTDWMLATGHLDTDSGMLFIGPQAERRYGPKLVCARVRRLGRR